MQYKQKYVLPTIHLAIRSAGILPLILTDYCSSILCLSASFLAGETLRLSFLYKREYLQKPPPDDKDAQRNIAREVTKSTIWMSMGLSLVIANPLIDLIMVGRLGEGSASLVEYAGRLRGLPVLAFNGILILLLGEWANQYAKGTLKWKNVSRCFSGSLIIASAGVVALGLSIDHWLSFIFFSNKFTDEELSALKMLLLYYFAGIPMLIGVFVLTRVLVIYQRFRIFTAITVSGFLLNIFFNFLFINIFGLHGVAMSTSVVDLISAVSLYTVSRKLVSNKNNHNLLLP